MPGENYSALFLIDSFKLAKNTKVDNGETAINLRLYLLTLQGAQDARILLSPKDRSSAYEIGACVCYSSRSQFNFVLIYFLKKKKKCSVHKETRT